MKTVHLVAGAGGMYCGSCLYGNTLVAAMSRLGADAMLAPLYTPVRTDEASVSIERVGYGGVNVYLQQRWPWLRHLPGFVQRWLDRPGLLDRLARRSSTTRPELLGELTVSMLRGEEGRQRAELDKLVDWLESDVRPEVVHLNNALLAGMARQIAGRLRVPVVASLTGEDSFVEKLPGPYRGQVRALLQERCGELAGMTAMNAYYADFMSDYLAVDRRRIAVIRPGLNLDGHATQPPERSGDGPITIGFLARVCADKGLDQLAEAFLLLADDAELPPVQLHAAGYLDEAERPYLEAIESRVVEAGLGERFRYVGEVDRPGKIAFMQSLDLFSVPAVHPECKGLSIFEAWANGVPAVLPAHGAFPEMVAEVGGGVLCKPGDPVALADALRRLILDREEAARLGCNAQQTVHRDYHAEAMAQRTLDWYEELTA